MYNFREWQQKFYQSKEWKTIKAEAISLNKLNYSSCLPVCNICKTRIKRTKANKHERTAGWAYCDHIIEITEDNRTDISVTLNIDNLQVVCHKCHNSKTFMTYEINDFELKNRKDVNLF